MKPWLAAILLFVIGAGALAWSSRTALAARSAASRAEMELRLVAGQVQELAALRARAPVVRTPGTGLAGLVSQTLSRCGLPPAALGSLSPGSATGDGRRQRATVTLASVTLPQVGSFLAAWREAQTGWIVASVDLNPVHSGAAGGAGTAPGGDLPLRAVIGIEALSPDVQKVPFVNQPGGDR